MRNDSIEMRPQANREFARELLRAEYRKRGIGTDLANDQGTATSIALDAIVAALAFQQRAACRCVDCGGDQPKHDPHCAYMHDLHGDPTAVEAQDCGCGLATCVEPWEPGCGLGTSDAHAVAQGGGEVVVPWVEEWQGSGPQRGYHIREATRLHNNRVVAYLGDQVSGAEVDKLIAAHNGKHPNGEPIRTAPPSAPVGWKLVPVEPTPEMRQAYHDVMEAHESATFTTSPDDQWNAMLAAAPALAQQPAAVDGAYPTPRNRAEAVAFARLALAYLGVIDAHIDAAIARCETDVEAQQGDHSND